MLRNHLVWNDYRHSVGNSAIDSEHQRIIETINRINDCLSDKQGLESAWHAMDELVAFTRDHFAHEEQIMAEFGYPDAPAHIAEHHKLLDQIGNLIGEARQAPSQVRASLVTAFLADWAELHILHEDRKLGAYLATQGKMPSPRLDLPDLPLGGEQTSCPPRGRAPSI